MKKLIDKLYNEHTLQKDEYVALLSNVSKDLSEYLFARSAALARERFGNKIYIRGLIEFTNYCKNNCFYCGIRAENIKAERYRLSKEDILSCCQEGYALGYRTFVLQGGEDPHFNDDILCDIVYSIKSKYPDCAVTLSVGERSRESYQRLFDSGANRYLLRHETADASHYSKLHPVNMSLENRMECLYNLKDIGYQTGTGFMVGSPYQTAATIAEDLLFISRLKPQMVGIGPFIPHKDTPFRSCAAGSMEMTLFLIGVLRLMIPPLLIPSTTALGTISPTGREKGILAGANVVMPNLSPVKVRKKYALYDNKICTGEEAAECSGCLERRMNSIGYTLCVDRGDYKEI